MSTGDSLPWLIGQNLLRMADQLDTTADGLRQKADMLREEAAELHRASPDDQTHHDSDGRACQASVRRSRSPRAAPRRDAVQPLGRSLSPGSRPDCINVSNMDRTGQCEGPKSAVLYVLRTARRVPGGKWQFTCRTCGDWMEKQEMFDEKLKLTKRHLQEHHDYK